MHGAASRKSRIFRPLPMVRNSRCDPRERSRNAAGYGRSALISRGIAPSTIRTPTHANRVDAMPYSQSSEREIENLIATYAFLVDDGEFENLGALLDRCDFTLGPGPTIRGKEAVAKLAWNALYYGFLMTARRAPAMSRPTSSSKSMRTPERRARAPITPCFRLRSILRCSRSPAGVIAIGSSASTASGISRSALSSWGLAGDLSHHRL